MKPSPFWVVVPMLGLLACSRQAPEPVAAAPSGSSPAITAPAAADDYPAVLQAAGTEPFWGVRVSGAALDYTTPDTRQNPQHLQGTREMRDGRLLVHGGEGQGAFRLTIQRASCSDGMSDLAHPYTAQFVLGAETFKGCARDPAVPVQAP
ncbi:hypothetical protein [Stenotrophomonas sp. YIM B06876]|uniref:hypothetical protein n=1 Tax=Stenotrophomonas sp. YIM B06876 TaxID=3060211 RepID=UPI00273A03DB|nr:hypothetical protein [Stenotrophomonas sp. YIM B06876]